MSAYNNIDFVNIYDTLYENKVYNIESKFLEDAYKKFTQDELKNIVDVGCGTGRHATHLAQMGYNVVGIDPSKEMISIAKKNRTKLKNCEFIHGYPSSLNGNYQMACSMFDVVNHITELEDLVVFFKSIRNLLHKDRGIFVFDCFNGIATIKNPPTNRFIEIDTTTYGKISRNTISTTSLMESKLEMHNTVRIEGKDFSYDLTLRLWSPMVLNQALKASGFEVKQINRPYNINTLSNENDYKIIFVCIAR